MRTQGDVPVPVLVFGKDVSRVVGKKTGTPSMTRPVYPDLTCHFPPVLPFRILTSPPFSSDKISTVVV